MVVMHTQRVGGSNVFDRVFQVLVQLPPLRFDRQDLVGSLDQYALSNFILAPQGVNGGDATFQVQQPV